MEDELGNTTPDIWFSFPGQSLISLSTFGSDLCTVLTYSNNNNRKP